MKDKVWVVKTEWHGDYSEDYDAYYSLFRDYNDALTEYLSEIENESDEECGIMGGNMEDSYIEEQEEDNGDRFWTIESSSSERYSRVSLIHTEIK